MSRARRSQIEAPETHRGKLLDVHRSLAVALSTIQWYWARTRDKASHGPIPIPLGYRGHASPSEQEEDERGPMLTSAIKDLLKKWEDVRAMVLEGHPNQADVGRLGDLYNDNAINYFRKILKKREKQSTLDMFFNAP
ncbi:uncharacterized protein TNCV_1473611 [Trichonephila clavipes]|nr:uncharacterized protein TNCV_1473611 [Trichonephila clavipes]